jgi:hypothetical protein
MYVSSTCCACTIPRIQNLKARLMTSMSAIVFLPYDQWTDAHILQLFWKCMGGIMFHKQYN